MCPIYTTLPTCKFILRVVLHTLEDANLVNSFGALPLPDGSYVGVPEHFPHNWTNRAEPYSLVEISAQIFEMYTKNPVGFGGNAGLGNWVGIDFPPYILNGTLTATTPREVSCLLFQILSRPFPSSLNGIITPIVETLEALLITKFGIQFVNLGCPFALT